MHYASIQTKLEFANAGSRAIEAKIEKQEKRCGRQESSIRQKVDAHLKNELNALNILLTNSHFFPTVFRICDIIDASCKLGHKHFPDPLKKYNHTLTTLSVMI